VISFVGEIPNYLVVFPHIRKVSNVAKRTAEDSDDDNDHYIIEGLSIPDMMVKLQHNTKLFSPGYGFTTCLVSVCINISFIPDCCQTTTLATNSY